MSDKSHCVHTHWIASSSSLEIKCTKPQHQADLKHKTKNTEDFLTSISQYYSVYSSLPLYNPDYVLVRKHGISLIKGITREFSLSDSTFHLGIALLDRISTKIHKFTNIKPISMFCIILATKFSDENAPKAKWIERKYSKSWSTNYKNDEIYILNLLDYEIHLTTSYDLLTILINLPFISDVFSKISFTLFEHTCFAYWNKLIECKSTLTLTPIQIASGIMQIISMKFKYGLWDTNWINNEQWITDSLIGYNLFRAEFEKCRSNYLNKVHQENPSSAIVHVKPRKQSVNSNKSNISTDDDAEGRLNEKHEK